MIRQGGIARFDSRDARETIKHLIDLIRDERAGFAFLGTDLISSELETTRSDHFKTCNNVWKQVM